MPLSPTPLVELTAQLRVGVEVKDVHPLGEPLAEVRKVGIYRYLQERLPEARYL